MYSISGRRCKLFSEEGLFKTDNPSLFLNVSVLLMYFAE